MATADYRLAAQRAKQLAPAVRQNGWQRCSASWILTGDIKSCFDHLNEGFDCLGPHLRKYDGKPLVKPAKKKPHTFLEKVRGLIAANQAGKPGLKPS